MSEDIERENMKEQLNEGVRIMIIIRYTLSTTNHSYMYFKKDVYSSICVSDLTTSNIEEAQVRVIQRFENVYDYSLTMKYICRAPNLKRYCTCYRMKAR